jgi:hypothetical protein
VKRAFAGLALLAPALVLVWPSGCTPSDARIGVDAPDYTIFPPAADLLAYRCGSLDCHGSPQRNFVIWSCYGLRLDQDAAPGCRNMGGTNTTPDEYAATFRSLVGLEPAVMSEVVQSHGQNPDLLTFVRKARGEESHKGGTLFVPGDNQDTCIADWLQDSSDTKAQCERALAIDIDAGTL